MKIYILRDPVDLSCARLSLVDESGNKSCDVCGKTIEFIKPKSRTYEWINGSDTICDFVWPSKITAEVIVTKDLSQLLVDHGVDLIPIDFFEEQNKKWRADYPKGPCIKLPYDGPQLFIAYIDNWIHLDKKRSLLEPLLECDSCKYTYYKPLGVEENKQKYNLKSKKLDRIISPRKKGKGVFVSSELITEVDFFRIHETPHMMYCTEKGKKVIESNGYTNVLFIEMGETY